MKNNKLNENKNSNIKNIKKILENFDFNLINFDIINQNINILKKLFDKIKNIYFSIDDFSLKNNIQYDIVNLKNSQTLLKHIQNFVDTVGSSKLKNFIDVNVEKLFMIQYSNIKFIYPYSKKSKLEEDMQNILKLFKITICLNKIFCPNDDTERIIIWIPIHSNRDFNFTEIKEKTLTNSIDNFNAFTVSGLTYGGGSTPRFTIISRYEEIEKLLIHELIHNFYIDGCNHHSNLKDTIVHYKNHKSLDNHDYEFSMYETYTELLSTYIYLIFLNINLPDNQIEKKLLGQIITEIIYSYNIICNLIKLNNYKNLDDFLEKQVFEGSICFYEYYYLKGLSYNHLLLEFPKNKEQFSNLYKNITLIIKKAKSDLLLKHIFNNYVKQQNFKYIFN